jgi:hypothetical protein
MTQDGLCNRPNKDGSPCKNGPAWGDSCSAHLTAEEKAERDSEWREDRRRFERDAQNRREAEMIRYLSGFMAQFAPLKDGEADLAMETLRNLIGALHDISVRREY